MKLTSALSKSEKPTHKETDELTGRSDITCIIALHAAAVAPVCTASVDTSIRKKYTGGITLRIWKYIGKKKSSYAVLWRRWPKKEGITTDQVHPFVQFYEARARPVYCNKDYQAENDSLLKRKTRSSEYVSTLCCQLEATVKSNGRVPKNWVFCSKHCFKLTIQLDFQISNVMKDQLYVLHPPITLGWKWNHGILKALIFKE